MGSSAPNVSKHCEPPSEPMNGSPVDLPCLGEPSTMFLDKKQDRGGGR